MLASRILTLSCCDYNFSLPSMVMKFKNHSSNHSRRTRATVSSFQHQSKQPPLFSQVYVNKTVMNFKNHNGQLLHICQCSIETQNQNADEEEVEVEKEASSIASMNGGNEEERDWTTSILLFVFWGGLIYYVSILAPNQTPSTDMYLVQKLLNLKGDDGFHVNQVLVALWNIMGLWPLVYSMLLLPTARSAKNRITVWPFLVLSFFGGAYALIPYFVLWTPPPPPIEEEELKRWPLNFLESKLTTGLILVSGLGLLIYAAISGEEAWIEFFQYFRGSKLVHLTSIDFSLLSTFAPFWVYNDMTARKWYDKGFWLLPLSLVPFLGPALYLLLRPSLSSTQVSVSQTNEEGK
ncbi:hypothetical protein Leryth_016768 [Lithospermum erythrorhizon]|nr:hypothetical protein Leryth_016768 [Lithospermum erythrorhizon]